MRITKGRIVCTVVQSLPYLYGIEPQTPQSLLTNMWRNSTLYPPVQEGHNNYHTAHYRHSVPFQLVPGTGIEPVFARLSGGCLRVYKAPS
jgi:hypothetical protein